MTEGHEAFHQEKAELKAAGLATSPYLQADDTGARHPGRNGYCTSIGNGRFAGLASTDSKSRVNFLELLQAERGYAVNAEALAYRAQRGLAAGHCDRLAAARGCWPTPATGRRTCAGTWSTAPARWPWPPKAP